MSSRIITSDLIPHSQEITYLTFDPAKNSWNSISSANIGGSANEQALSQVLKIAEQGSSNSLGVQDPYLGANGAYTYNPISTNTTKCNNYDDIKFLTDYVKNNGIINNTNSSSQSYIYNNNNNNNLDNIYGYDYRSAGLLTVDERIRLGQCNESNNQQSTIDSSVKDAIASIDSAILKTTTEEAAQSESQASPKTEQPPVDSQIINAIKPLGEAAAAASTESSGQPAAAVVTTTETEETTVSPIAAAVASSVKADEPEDDKIVEVAKLAQAPAQGEETAVTETEVVNAEGKSEAVAEGAASSSSSSSSDDDNKKAESNTTTTASTEETVVAKEEKA